MMIVDQSSAAEISSAKPAHLKITNVDEPIQYQLQILNRHLLPGLIPCHQKQQNGHKQLWHDISGLVSLPEYLDQCVADPSDGERVIQEISEIICQSARYLMPPNQISMTVEQIYISKPAEFSSPIWTNRPGAVHLIFWPVYPRKMKTLDEPLNQADARQFADEETQMVKETFSLLIQDICGLFDINQTRQQQLLCILQKQGISRLVNTSELERENSVEAHHDETTNQNTMHRPASNLSSGQQRKVDGSRAFSIYVKFGLSILLHLVLIGSAAAILTRLFDPGPILRLLILTAGLLMLAWHLLKLLSPSIQMKTVYLREQIDNWIFQLRHQVKVLSQPREQADDTTAADRMQQTLVMPTDPASFRIATLTENPPGVPAEKDGLRVFILVEQFIIGRDQNKTDLYLPESAIGRQHARISRKGGSFFICDLGSKNGTRLNDQLLEKHKETILPESCRLQFADHLFYFKAEE